MLTGPPAWLPAGCTPRQQPGPAAAMRCCCTEHRSRQLLQRQCWSSHHRQTPAPHIAVATHLRCPAKKHAQLRRRLAQGRAEAGCEHVQRWWLLCSFRPSGCSSCTCRSWLLMLKLLTTAGTVRRLMPLSPHSPLLPKPASLGPPAGYTHAARPAGKLATGSADFWSARANDPQTCQCMYPVKKQPRSRR